jgi:hypothetical protein
LQFVLKLKSLPAALPSEALAPVAPTSIGCFPTAEGKPADKKSSVPMIMKIKKKTPTGHFMKFTISNKITSYGKLHYS